MRNTRAKLQAWTLGFDLPVSMLKPLGLAVWEKSELHIERCRNCPRRTAPALYF